MLKTPVLFLIFNRPDTTEKVFQAIRQVKPKYLYVAADGARENKQGEAELCKQTRAIIEQIDWDCEVKTLFRSENLGCKRAISSGISWFFENVEQGIILEDDCLPSQGFFHFCDELLEKYKNDDRIFTISGNNFQDGQIRGKASYYFSRQANIWGWATWKRAWQNYDVEMKTLQSFIEEGLLEKIFKTKKEQEFWGYHFKETANGKIDTWDFQLNYASFSQNRLNIIPNKNLVSNIGFRPDASRTKSATNKFSNMPAYEPGKVIHPAFILPDEEADEYIFKNLYSYSELKPLNKFMRAICPIIKW